MNEALTKYLEKFKSALKDDHRKEAIGYAILIMTDAYKQGYFDAMEKNNNTQGMLEVIND